VFQILQSPPDVAQIFWTCQLHTTWQLLHHNGGSELGLDYLKMATENHNKAAGCSLTPFSFRSFQAV
jgi:hypothetical protein